MITHYIIYTRARKREGKGRNRDEREKRLEEGKKTGMAGMAGVEGMEGMAGVEGMEGLEGMAGVTAGVRYNRTIQNGRRQTEEEADSWEAKLANDKQSRRKLTKG